MAKVYVVYRDDYYTNNDIDALHDKKLMKIFDSLAKASDYIIECVECKYARIRSQMPACDIEYIYDWVDVDSDEQKTLGGRGIWCHEDEWYRTFFYSCEPVDVE